MVYGTIAWQYALSKWDGTNLDRLIAHGCGVQQLIATYGSAAHMVYFPLIGGCALFGIGAFTMQWQRSHLPRTVAAVQSE
jgi:hypothetical protein